MTTKDGFIHELSENKHLVYSWFSINSRQVTDTDGFFQVMPNLAMRKILHKGMIAKIDHYHISIKYTKIGKSQTVSSSSDHHTLRL